MKAAGSLARIESNAPVSKISRASRRMDDGVFGWGVKAWSFKRVILAAERSGVWFAGEEDFSFLRISWRSRSDILRSV